MFNDVLFGKTSLYEEFGLVLTNKDIGVPKMKGKTVDVDGADGSIDLSSVFGRVYYENRKLSFTFKIGDRSRPFVQVFSDVQNLLHGKEMDIILTDDEFWKYHGRVTVNKWKVNKHIGEMVIDVDAEPFKVSTLTSYVQWTSAGDYNVLNKGFVVTGTLTVTGTVTIDSVAYTEGSYDFDLTQGVNAFTLTGSGFTASLSFNERRL